MDLIGLLIQVIVAIIVVAPILWLVGRSLAGKQNAKFTDAIWIVVLGIVIGAIVSFLVEAILPSFGGLIAAIVMFFVWLGLIKHFFDCSWFKAFAIAVVSVIVFVIVIVILAVVLALIGIGIGFGLGAFGF